MVPLWSLLSRIRLNASAPVLAAAEDVMHRIADQFIAPNLSLAEVRELALHGDPLEEFGNACRAELDAIEGE